MTHTISMEATDRLEVGFGHVLPGKEEWMYGEYFPAMGPVMARHGFSTLAAFQVVASNVPDDVAPVQGSFSRWPSADHRRRFIEDPEFVAIRPTRDAALRLSDGHLFEPLSDTLEIVAGEDFAIVVAGDGVAPGDALFRVPLAKDAPTSTYAGKCMSLHRWNDACERLLAGSHDDAAVLRVRFLPPS